MLPVTTRVRYDLYNSFATNIIFIISQIWNWKNDHNIEFEMYMYTLYRYLHKHVCIWQYV